MKDKWSSEPQNLSEKACVDYFREYPVFQRLLNGFRDKYNSYGSFSGTVVIRNVAEEERDILEGFFQKNFHGQKSISVSAKRFEKALQESCFAEVTPRRLLELYFCEPIAGKKERKQKEEQMWTQMYEEVLEWAGEKFAAGWVRKMQNESPRGKNNIEEVRSQVMLGVRMIDSFPAEQNRMEYLAVFAARVTGNPHAFDEGTKEGQLLYQTIQWYASEKQISISGNDLFPALYKQRLCLLAGILRDDISNYAILSGIHAVKKDGRFHAGIEGFFQERDIVQVPLSVIAGWKSVRCPEQKIYIVENPSVYANLCEKFRGERACMCMNGQPRLSALLILDLLAESCTKIYYSGDFDPEGLLIAQKLKQYYKGEFLYWHMSVNDYEACRSEQPISEKRLKILNRITDANLLEVAAAIRKTGKAGYQENAYKYQQPIPGEEAGESIRGAGKARRPAKNAKK
ncbi:MAG: TIGR02679 domain-containing protein [Clostridiaceae bacterium]|nr:TIGR02679 domain-containing protein [Clostridiaceae bacterium]